MVYFQIELFADALLLLLHHNTPEVKKLITNLIGIYNKETKETAYSENKYFELYIKLLEAVRDRNLTYKDQQEIASFLLKFKTTPQLVEDPELYTSLKNIFQNQDEMSEDTVKTYVRKITNCILWYNNTRAIKRMFGKLMGNSSGVDVETQTRVLSELNTMCSDIIQTNQETLRKLDDEEDNHRVTVLDSDNKDNILKALKVMKETHTVNTFKMGLQGLNKALGGGVRLGTSIVVNSLAHMGKSLILLKFLRWHVTLNKPMEDIKNPTAILYSLENETPQNLMQLFEEMYINKYKKLPPEDLTDEQIAAFCYDEFRQNGWRLVIDRRLGANFGFPELVANFNEYVSSGYTPMLVVIDYMNMMRKGRNINEGADGNHLLVRELYTNICNFLKANNCTLITAHQLNRKAAEAARMNPMGAVKRFGVDMLSDAIDPQREVDVAIYMHKEFDAVGRPWLTFKVDKVRYETIENEDNQYFAYLFDGPIGILDDVNGECKAVKNINAAPIPEEDITKGVEVSGEAATSSISLFAP